ncbi:hypothetical protein JZ751_028997 [Albula glossodonta]|uniref:UDP-glucuronate decarboxylase n=1 Tax=Albula glossodonta TaxID=121402 RepID=A0A8T2P9Q7_9TELE|nr:hypothetical protein JZ751_028997 [Albula glossodonta]
MRLRKAPALIWNFPRFCARAADSARKGISSLEGGGKRTAQCVITCSGNPEEHTILEFARLIKSLVVSRSQIQFLPEAQDDPQRRRPDIRKAKMLLGWEPVANNQYIPKPKPARMKKGRSRHN